MKNFKYAIFDLDGTLLESMEAWNNCGNELLLNKGVYPPDNVNEIIKPMTLKQSAQYFQKAFNIGSSVEDLIREMNIIMEEKYKNELKLKPFVKEYLEILKSKNVKMCIASATPLHMIEYALRRLDVYKYFEFISSCDEVGVGKNHPDIFLYAAEKLKSEPFETVVFEDADFALITAREAGFYTIGVYDKYFSDRINNIKAASNVYIESFKELL